jgi:hypothetical protein
MWQLGLGALLVVCGLGSAVRAEAQPARAPLVLVVESSDGLTGANQLRATLSKQFGVKVLALGEVDLDGEQPGALMAIATEFCSRAEPRASTRTNAVRVVYVDVYGRRDTLRAPAPPRREDLQSVVQALAGALLQRHLKDLAPPGLRDPQNGDNHLWLDEESRLSLSAFSRSLHAALNRIGYPRHRSGDLHRDDF